MCSLTALLASISDRISTADCFFASDTAAATASVCAHEQRRTVVKRRAMHNRRPRDVHRNGSNK
jgi:hypothetical protein